MIHDGDGIVSISWFHCNGPIYSSITDDDNNTTFRGNSGAYRETCNQREAMSLLRDKLATYNSNPINSYLDLVLFEDTIKRKE